MKHTFAIVSGLAALVLGGALPDAALAQQGSPVERAAAARVEPGDRIVLKVWREPLLSDTVMVDARGTVVLPKVGIVPVANLGILELQDTLRARLAGFLRDPSVEVVVLRRLVVSGEVMKPGVYYVDVGTAVVRDAVALAGGMSADGHAGRVAIVRDGRTLPVPDWEDSDGSSVALRSGDQVLVGRRSWLARNSGQVLGAVGLAATITFSIISLTR